jgi:glycosyltransferase involved in cell wall biosynthesis
MASGHAVICTAVGNAQEIYESEKSYQGDTGIILVERNVDAIAEALSTLTPQKIKRMGEINRQEVIERWAWRVWSEAYSDFLRLAL